MITKILLRYFIRKIPFLVACISLDLEVYPRLALSRALLERYHKTFLKYVLTLLILLGRGGAIWPPLVVFLHNSKSIGLRLLKFSDFSYIPKALPLGLKPDFNTNSLSPQAHCLNDWFFLQQTKSLFWPTSTC